MLININTLPKYQKLEPSIRIYRDGNYDFVATYRPVVLRQIRTTALKIDHWFVHHEWPVDDIV